MLLQVFNNSRDVLGGEWLLLKQVSANAGNLGFFVVFLEEQTTEFTFCSIVKFLFYNSVPCLCRVWGTPPSDRGNLMHSS